MLTPSAHRDLSEISDYSRAQWGTAQADRYILLIATASLSRRPAPRWRAGTPKGRSAEALRPGYFRQAVGSHVLFYRARKRGGIEIVRILHRRMDVERHL